MRFPDQSHNLRVDLDMKQCRLRPDEVRKLEEGLGPLRAMVEHFPVSTLHVLVEHNARTRDFTVKTSLALCGRTLVAGDLQPHVHPAFENCVDNLVRELKEYEGELGRTSERRKQSKGTHQSLLPTVDPDPAALDAAAADGSYTAFRRAAAGYEEPVRLRVGRWLERYPELGARVGRDLSLEDFVEEVFLNAFECYGIRPREIRLGDWFESLIDSAVRGLSRGDGELENVRLARSARLAEEGPEAR